MTRRSLFPGARTWCAVLVTASSALIHHQAKADDFLDSRITFAFEDPHVLANARDGYPRGGFFEDDRASTFFDNYDTQYSGRETMAHLVLYKRMTGYLPGMDIEGALVTRMLTAHDPNTGKPFTSLRDDGTYIKISYYPASARARRVGNGFALTVFPFDSDRFRLGYSYDITWGDKHTFVGNTDPVPAAKLEYTYTHNDRFKADAFFGAKNARLLDSSINEQETYWGFLGGGGIDLMNRVRLDLQGGLFQKGPFPPKGQIGPDGTDLLAGRTIYAYGVSARAGYHSGTPIGRSADFKLYRRDPYYLAEDLKREVYDSSFSFAAESEFSQLGQDLIVPEKLGTTIIQPARAADLNVRLKYKYLRAHFDIVYRSLSFILFDVPSMSPYYDFPQDSKHTDEAYGAVGVDYYFRRPRLTPGITVGYETPATYTGVVSELADQTSSDSTIVVREEGNFDILPAGQKKFDILTTKLTCRWNLADYLDFLGEVSYTLDKNQTKYVKNLNGDGSSVRVFDDPDVYNKISVSLFLQARF